MKRFTIAAILLLVTAFPARATLLSGVCKNFPGPDGAGGAHLYVCLYVDLQSGTVRPFGRFENIGTKTVEVHVSYLKLIRGSTDVRNSGPQIFTVPVGDPPTNRVDMVTSSVSGAGTYHSRLRMWPVWVGLPGDPVGSVLVWNSGTVTI